MPTVTHGVMSSDVVGIDTHVTHGDFGRNVAVVLNIPIDRLRMETAIARVLAFTQGKQPRQIVTVNPEFVMRARGNAAFRRVLQKADLAVADGIGIVLASRLLGTPVPERIGGVNLVERFAGAADRCGTRILLGAREGVAAQAADRLKQRYPRLNIVGTYGGSPRVEDEARIVDVVREAHPDMLLVAFGAPAQELWIARNKSRLGVPVAIGVGGTFDFIAGRVARAPQVFQGAGLEWLYRLGQQPWRWKRMRALPQFAALVLWDRCSAAITGQISVKSSEPALRRRQSVAITHDYLTQYGGAEKVLEALVQIWPDADVYTTFFDRSRMRRLGSQDPFPRGTPVTAGVASARRPHR